MSKKNLSFVLLMVSSWALYFVLCKICITTVESPFMAGFFLRFMTFGFLSLYWIMTKKHNKIKIPIRPLFLTIGVGSVAFVFDALINIGFQFIPVSIGSILLKTEILFVLLFSLIFLRIIIRKRNYLFIVLMLLGIILCMDINSSDMQFNSYNFLFIASAALNAVCAFAIKHIQEKYRTGSFAIAYTSNIVSLIFYSICTTFGGGSQISNVFLEFASIGYVIGIFVLGSVCQTCLMITYYRNLKELPVWVVKAFLLFVPALSMIIEFIILRTTINTISFLGFALVLLGALGITINSKSTQ